jgi:hypothetical protein
MAQVSSYVLHASVGSGVDGIRDVTRHWNHTFVRTQHCRGLRVLLDIFDVVDEHGDFGEEWIIIRESVGLL